MYRIVRTKEMAKEYAEGITQPFKEFDVEAFDITLPPFRETLAGFDEDTSLFSKQNLGGVRTSKLEAFLSTPRFVKFLTDIGTKLSSLKISKEEKKAILTHDLQMLN